MKTNTSNKLTKSETLYLSKLKERKMELIYLIEVCSQRPNGYLLIPKLEEEQKEVEIRISSMLLRY